MGNIPTLLNKAPRASLESVTFLWQKSLGNEIRTHTPEIIPGQFMEHVLCFMKQSRTILSILTKRLQFPRHFTGMLCGPSNHSEHSNFFFTFTCITETPHTQPSSVIANGHILVHLILITPLS